MHRNGIVVTSTVVRVVANCLSNYYALILLLFVGQVDVMSLKMVTFRLPPHDFVSSSLVNQVRRFTTMVMFNCGLLHYVCASSPW